jgi:hypothetical protein
VIVKGGKVSFPRGGAITADELTVENPDVITGMTGYSKDGSETEFIDIYGEVYTDQSLSEDLDEYSAIVFTVKNGARWTVDLPAMTDTILGKESTFLIEKDGEIIFKGEGWLDIHGTLTNKGKFTNNSNIYNDSANTLNNQGMLTNNGLIYNDSTGKITNTGTIDNTKGKIENKGVFESVQTPEEMGGTIDGPVQLIGSSSGGGCNTGIGVFGLLLLVGLATRKCRLTRSRSPKIERQKKQMTFD